MLPRTALLGLLGAVPILGGAGELPDPVFWPDDAAFVERVGRGQFDDLLELHLLQYSADAAWRGEWRALRYAANGLFGEWGSTTSSELFVDSAIAVDVFPVERFQMRYDRREHRDGRFDLQDQRFEALWYPGPGFALALTGWPSFEKERASLGAGLRLGAPRARDALELRIVDDGFVWNDRTRGDVRLERQPLRLIADGHLEAGAWRAHGSIDLGREWRALDRVTGRTARGLQRSGDVEASWGCGGWTAGARATVATEERQERQPSGEVQRLERDWRRGVLSLRGEQGRWSGAALAGWAWQRDDFGSLATGAGRYVERTLLLGLEAAWQATRGLSLRLGYLAGSGRAERRAGTAGPLPARLEDGYRDKAHLRAIYTFAPGMAIEALLSQALRGGAFGGGSVKALFAF